MRPFLLVFLFLFSLQHTLVAAAPKPMDTPTIPRIVERILVKKALDKEVLVTKKEEIQAQLQEAERLRDPIQKWLWYGVITFSLGLLFVIAAAQLQKAQGTASPDVNDSCLTVLLALFGVLGIFSAIVLFGIWFFKLTASSI